MKVYTRRLPVTNPLNIISIFEPDPIDPDQIEIEMGDRPTQP